MYYQQQFFKIFVILCCLIIDVVVGNVVSGQHGATLVDIDDFSVGSELDSFPKDCRDFLPECSGPESSSGVYLIKPEGYKDPFDVYCDNDVDGGGWTVIQRRMDGTIDFERNWDSYKTGFGFLNSEFWIGNEKLAYLTNQNKYALRIDIVNSTGFRMYLHYDNFRITEEKNLYALVALGDFTGDVTDKFDYMRELQGATFATHDHGPNARCATKGRGGWWFDQCKPNIFLNGVYKDATSADAIKLRNSELRVKYIDLRFTEMKIRPV